MLIAKEIFKLDVKHDWHWEFTTRSYSTDISAAWEVVEKCENFNCYVDLIALSNKRGWKCAVYDVNKISGNAIAETAPLAICRAALLAVMEAK